MGPEIIAAIIGPVFAGVISTFVWIGKRNADRIDKGFYTLQSTVSQIDTKVDDLGISVAKEYVTTDWMVRQMAAEERSNTEINERLDFLRSDLMKHIEDSNDMAERFRNDIAEIKDMQWQTRMEMLDIYDKTKNGNE